MVLEQATTSHKGMTRQESASQMPLVGVTSCTHQEGDTAWFRAGEKYATAMLRSAKAMPFILPTYGDELPVDTILDRLDGLLFTGSLSNVYPEIYGHEPSKDAEPYDRERDGTTLPLLQRAIERGVPTFCICRGFQELNVVMGGTLYPLIHEVEGRIDHRRKPGDYDTQYGPHHPITVTPGGMLDGMLTGDEPLIVNSLHLQGVRDLGPGLNIEAIAEDGTVEAVSLKSPNGFLLAVQWHPEFKSETNPLSTTMFKAFGKALRS